MENALHISVNPAFAGPLLWALGAAALALTAYALWRRAKGAFWRGLALSLLFIALLNPSVVREERAYLRDTALIVLDESASMKLGDRAAQAKAAAHALIEDFAARPGIDIETLRVKGDEQTDLFQAIAARLGTLPANRIAGIVAVTDGEAHDAPSSPLPAPLHALIAGQKHEHDRRLIVKEAPAYGMVGKPLNVTLRVEDVPANTGENVPVVLTQDDGSREEYPIPAGRDVNVEITPSHAGVNRFAFTAAPMEGEITALNNTALVVVNGIRDRLRVLLVSSQPHIGERVWRDFLKSDPAVDMVHFTILRSLLSRDRTPDQELALIPFPVHELFDVKLSSFDLIILDRFRNQSVIPPHYLQNIAKYVADGGALLVSSATDADAVPAASPLTPLMPAPLTGVIDRGEFVPALTALGRRHPVTAPLEKIGTANKWGPWFRQVEASAANGDVLMTGLNRTPLLVLNHVGDGRVAEFTTDQFWLWARGYRGGGPEAELLRRTVHWLLKEPELEEETLHAEAVLNDDAGAVAPASDGGQPSTTPTPDASQPRPYKINISRQTLHDETAVVDIEKPDGKTESVTLSISTDAAKGGALTGSLAVTEPGLYRISDSDHHTTMVVAGASNAPEFGAMVATADILSPVADKSGGDVHWLADGMPDLSLKKNNQYNVTGSRAWPLLPPLALVVILLAAALWAWRREGK